MYNAVATLWWAVNNHNVRGQGNIISADSFINFTKITTKLQLQSVSNFKMLNCIM